MRLTFWGTRGSIPTPGPGTVIFGGNTVCIEVDCSDDSLIILDSGTGIRLLGYDIMRRQVRKIKLFITHTHWDHIQGLPYFAPFYHPDCEIDVYGPLYYGKTFEDVLSVQMDHFFFPVQQKELRAAIRYHDLKEGDCIQFPGLSIQTKFMNHPVITLGYKLIFDQGTVTFTGDHEPYSLFQHHDNTSIKELKQQPDGVRVSNNAGTEMEAPLVETEE